MWISQDAICMYICICMHMHMHAYIDKKIDRVYVHTVSLF